MTITCFHSSPTGLWYKRNSVELTSSTVIRVFILILLVILISIIGISTSRCSGRSSSSSGESSSSNIKSVITKARKNNTQYLFIFGNKIQLYWRVRKRTERIRRLSTSWLTYSRPLYNEKANTQDGEKKFGKNRHPSRDSDKHACQYSFKNKSRY